MEKTIRQSDIDTVTTRPTISSKQTKPKAKNVCLENYSEISKQDFKGIVKTFEKFLTKIEQTWFIDSCNEAFLVEHDGKFFVFTKNC